MKKMNGIDWIACLLVIIGALNWGLMGFFGINLVAMLFGEVSIVTRVIYCAIGVAGVWGLIACLRCGCCKKSSS